LKRYRNKSKNKQEQKEKTRFLTAFTICILAIGLAIGSTYASIGGLDGNLSKGKSGYTGTSADSTEAVDAEVEGMVIEGKGKVKTTATATAEPTTAAQSVTEAPTTELPEPDVPDTKEDKLETIFKVSTSLLYPVNSMRVTKEYSEQAVYSETMEDYRPHTGTDFKAKAGEAVFSVSDGIVDDISEDDMYGNIIKITNGTYSVYYCGVGDDMAVEEGESVTAGQVIARVGDIPCETEDEPHIHMEVRVSGNYIDPMTVISNDR